RTRASETIATVIVPRARAGAIDASQRANPGARPTTLIARRGVKPRPTLSLPFLRERVIRLHDLLHQPVPDDVALVEIHAADAFAVPRDVERLHQTRHVPIGQIDLGDVAGDDRFRPEAETRQKHLHLLARRVLRL